MSRLLMVTAMTIQSTFTARPRSVDPCSLLSAAQVSAVLGITVETGKPLGTTACYWREPGGPAGRKVGLTLLTSERFAMGKKPGPGMEKPAVSGIGDEAYYKYFDASRYDKVKAVDLDVKKGTTFFGIEVKGFSVEDAKAKAKTLALAVLPKT